MSDADKLRPAREVLDEIMDAGDMGSACDRDPCKQCDAAIAVIEADHAQCLAALQAHADALEKVLRSMWHATPEHNDSCPMGALYNCACALKPANDQARETLRAYEAFKAGEPT